MFYSTPVLRPLMPGMAGSIGLGITGVNALITVLAILLMDVSVSNSASVDIELMVMTASEKKGFIAILNRRYGNYQCITSIRTK